MKKDIKILVACHKPYWTPDDDVYYPIHVGAAGKDSIGFPGDDTGDNISLKNPNFCELTGLYWAWKNLDCDVIGLCHYRRYFAKSGHAGDLSAKKAAIMTHADYISALEKADILLPKKRNYYIETVRGQYEHAHNPKDLAETERIIAEKYPAYSAAFTRVMNRKKLHILNMFVMEKSRFDAYCAWLFDILFELEKRIDITDYTPYEARVYGFLAERLFNVWLENEPARKQEIPVIFLEDINWPKKIYEFLKRKFL